MKFGPNQKLKFKSENGAYSIVTERENHDSQITATDQENELLCNFFGADNILSGNVRSDADRAERTFRRYPDGQEIHLNLVYPKPGNNELRLYLSKQRGFKPPAGDIWFLFELKKEMWIGSMEESDWRNQNRILVYDESEDDYQDSIQEVDEIKMNKLHARDVFARDRRIAIERMEQSKYKCENDEKHELFISKSTRLPYLEAHHLIPLAIQKNVSVALDTPNNVYCLCPFCHRAIHHAETRTTRIIIENLVQKRPEVLQILSDDITDIYNYYSVENII